MEPETAAPPCPPAQTVSQVATDGTAWTWRHRPDFGLWVRELRRTAKQTLREAATALGITFTRLQKLEVGGRTRAPSLELLTRLSSLYGKDLDLMLTRAGYKMEVPEDLRDAVLCDDAFAAVVLHPDLRPACMDERWLEAFSRVQKAQWLDFARKLEAHLLLRGGPCIDHILREARDPERTDQA